MMKYLKIKPNVTLETILKKSDEAIQERNRVQKEVMMSPAQ